MAQAPAPAQPDAKQAAEVGLLIAANQQASDALRTRVTAMLDHLWRSLGTWHRSDVARFVPQAIQLVEAGERQASALTSAYLSRYAQLHGIHLPTAAPDGLLTDIRGIGAAVEYERPFHDVWITLSNGGTLTDGVDAGAQHLQSLATTDMQLAKTKTAQAVLSSSDKIVGYRRVLEGTYSCGLCIVASTQRYRVKDLMPIHPGCDCGVAPIIGEKDPGRMLNAGLLADIHAALEERFGTSNPSATGYKDVIVVHEHGEIGPVLGVRGQDFKGPANLQTTP